MPENPNATDPDAAGSEHLFGGAHIDNMTTNANSNNNNNVQNNNNNNRKQSGGPGPRISSAGLKYYDIATQLLGKKGSDIEELFIAAARDGCFERLENFLQRNRSEYVISVDVKDKKTGNTPLIWAAKRGHAKIVQLLLRHGADITLRNYECQTAVEVASPSIRSILLESVERSTEASHQLLLQAAWQGDIKVVARLLSQKKVLDINCQNAEGFTPVMLATRDMQLFERLSTQMSRPYNPIEVVSELLSARADLHASDEDGKTCLHHAAQSKATIAPSVVATIISGGPNLEVKDKRSFTSIHCASLNGNADCISSLLKGGCDKNARGFAGATPLHITSYNNHEKATDVLLEHGADVKATDDRGLTPLDFAKTRKMKKKLQEAWAEVVNSRSTTNLGPVRSVSREDLRSSVEDLTKKKKNKGEVIFEGLPSNPFNDAKKDPVSKESDLRRSKSLREHSSLRFIALVRDLPTSQKDEDHGLRRSKSLRELGNLRIITLLDTWAPLASLPQNIQGSRGLTRHASLKDKNGKGEDENGAHMRDPVRKLGQVRSQPKPNPLPRGKSRSTERLPAISPDRLSSDRNLESPTPFSRASRSRRSFEDKRGRKPAPLPTREGSTVGDDTLEPRPTPRHHRSGSDPNRSTPNLMDIAASCENYLNNGAGSRRGRSYSVNSPTHANNLGPDGAQLSPPGQRETTNITPVQREATLMSVCSYRSDSRMSTNSNSPRLLNLGQMLCKSKTPVQNFPFGPTSSKVIPPTPTPTFLTQRQFSNADNKFEGDHSPRSDDEVEDDPMSALQRTRSIFKEEFVLEESRARDPLIQSSSSSSGTDTLSSTASSSRFSSPRDQAHAAKFGAQSKNHGAQSKSNVTQSKAGTQSKNNVTQSKSDRNVKGKSNQSESGIAKTGSKNASMSVSAKPLKLNEKSVPTVKVSGPGSNRPGSVQTQREGSGGSNSNSDTFMVHAMAMRNAAVLNMKGNSSNAKGAKSGGSILIHDNATDISDKGAKLTDVENKDVNVASECSKLDVNTNANKSQSDVSSTKDNKEIVTGTQKSDAQKRTGQNQKHGTVMQVVPTKLTENIIRTAPKQSKDKVDEKNAVRNVSSRSVQGKAQTACGNDSAHVSNINMKLSSSAGVNARVTPDPKHTAKKDVKAEIPESSKTNNNAKDDSKPQGLSEKSANESKASNATVNQVNSSVASSKQTSSTTIGANTKATTQISSNKPVSQQGPSQIAKTDGQTNATVVNTPGNPFNSANTRPGVQSRNINLKITRSAGTTNSRLNVNSRKAASGYTPRFSNLASQKSNIEKSDSNDKSEAKNDTSSAAKTLSKLNTEKASGNDGTKADAGKGNSSGSNSSSPTELVPPAVCRSVSLAKSYNMAPAKNPLSKSVGMPSSSDKSVSPDKIVASVGSVTHPSTTASIRSTNTSSTSAVSKSVSQMPAVGAVPTPKTNSLLRSSSMSTIEESNKEQKKMSSSDTMIKCKEAKQRRPLSDGSIVNENQAITNNPPLVEIRPDCSPRINKNKYVPSLVKIETPVIVNPFAELEQKREEETTKRQGKHVTATEFGFTVDKPSIERSKTQGSIRSKNLRSPKKAANGKDAKPSSASSRLSSGKRRKAKSKDGNKSDTESSRPKSGKTGKRVRSGKRKRKIPEPNLAKENERDDVALIGGIGWQLATSCIDKSEADAVIISAIDSSESDSDTVDIVRTTNPLHLQLPPNTQMHLPNSLETPTSLSSPRFKEVRPTFGAENEKRKLQHMDNDGFPPMNLDMTQSSYTQPNRSGVIIDNNIPDDGYSQPNRSGVIIDNNIPDDINDFLSKLRNDDDDTVFDDDCEDSESDYEDMEEDLANALVLDVGKLTPIPESPAQTHTSASLRHVAKTMDAIMKFDNNIKEDDLNKMLGLTPRDKPGSVKSDRACSVNIKSQSQRESSGSSRSTQSKPDSASSQKFSASLRNPGVRAASRAANQSKPTSANSGAKEKTEVIPKPKLSQISVPVRSNASLRSGSREQARRSGKISEKNEVQNMSSEAPKIKVSKTDDGAQIDLKKLLSEKMQTTMKLLEESHTRDGRSARKRQGEGKDTHLNIPAQTQDNLGGDSTSEESMKLDINALQDTDRKDDDLKSTGRSSRRERKFSETKTHSLNKEDDIEEAIDEIMSNTFPTRSTMRSYRSHNSTLTEADKNVLKQLSQTHQHSPFHAKEQDVRETVRASASYDENITLNKANPELLKRFHADEFAMGRKVKAMIDAGADTAKVRAMLQADGGNAVQSAKPDNANANAPKNKDVVKTENEAKQLVKIMHSFKQMELYAGPSHSHHRSAKKETPRKDGDFKSLSKFDNLSNPSGHLPPRPGSAGAGKLRKEKFTEIKETPASAQPRQPQSSGSAVPKDLAEEFKRSPYVQVEGSYQGVVASGFRGGTPDSGSVDGESLERPDSACTTLSTSSSVMEETIQWKKGNVLGKGAFGTVWCGLTSEGQLIAVKQIELNVTNQQKAKKEYEKVQEEVELLKTLEHRNIVGYLGTSLEDCIVSIFMQFVPGGSIASILARFGALDESVFRKYTRQILEGVEYLHSNDVIHRDIKGGNVMLMPNGVIKLIDFGCAKRLCINLSMGQSEILKSMKGTPYWMAPEVVNETGHGKKSDIWSVGCTVFEMATRKPPWADMNPMAAIFAIGSDRRVPQLPDKFSEEAREFVNCCLNRDQIKRMSASELLQSQFIRRRMKRSTTSVS